MYNITYRLKKSHQMQKRLIKANYTTLVNFKIKTIAAFS